MHSELHRLREQVDILKEENRQLKEEIGLSDSSSFEIDRARKFGIKPSGLIILKMLTSRKVARMEALIAAICGEDTSGPSKVVGVQISRLRREVSKHGIRIETAWNVGYYLDYESRENAKTLLAEIMK